MTAATLVLLVKGLDLLVLGIEMAPAIRSAFMDMTAAVRTMVEEGRDPTLTEWARLDELRDTVHRSIQDAHRD